jgi:hypothetical protein
LISGGPVEGRKLFGMARDRGVWNKHLYRLDMLLEQAIIVTNVVRIGGPRPETKSILEFLLTASMSFALGPSSMDCNPFG